MDKPEVIVFDVNETLSDLTPMADRFTDVGAPAHLARLWFASVLRDGFALATVERAHPFSAIGEDLLRRMLEESTLDRSLDDAVGHILDGFMALSVHPDVAEGVHALHDAGLRLVTLTNGATRVAENLLSGAGVLDRFERLMSVEDAGVWKPHARAYEYAASTCGTDLSRMLLVAVHPWDVDGATRAGMSTAWLNRGGGRYPAYTEPATLEVSALPELAHRLG
jgi:2-haloacid dehalogenase